MEENQILLAQLGLTRTEGIAAVSKKTHTKRPHPKHNLLLGYTQSQCRDTKKTYKSVWTNA